jgi:cell fate (sporulation/competence/biofilm development) regulator YlbF (YheA/YmcA/DUF963 family)
MELAEKLGEAIMETEEYMAFSLAQDKMNNDSEAHDLVEKFQGLQQELREAQMMGRQITQEQMEGIRSHQRKMVEHPAIKAFLEAKSRLENLMSAVHQIIGQKVGLSPSGGGCGGGCC